MPYSFITPFSHGHGSLGAATAAVIADLEPGKHYFLGNRDITAVDLAALLLDLSALEPIGREADPVSFCRSTGAEADDEFRIAPSRLTASVPTPTEP